MPQRIALGWKAFVVVCSLSYLAADAVAQAPAATGTPLPTATAAPTPKPAATPTSAATPTPTAAATKPAAPIDDWAKQVLKEDPLAKKAQVSAADLRATLADPTARDFALERHFARAELTQIERQEILKEALQNNSAVVRRQAARELSALKLLDGAVAERLLALVEKGDVETQRSVVVALKNVELPWKMVSPAYWKAIIESLGSGDSAASAAALQQIERWGPDAVPSLIEIMSTGDAAARKAVAPALNRIIGGAPQTPDMTVAIPTPTKVPSTISKAMPVGPEPKKQVLELDEKKPDMVRVYYGTNRQVLRTAANPRYLFYGLPVLFGFVLYRVYRHVSVALRERRVGRFVKTALAVVVLGGVSAAIVLSWNHSLREMFGETTGVVYGGRQAPNAEVRYGYCDVSIPRTHSVGEVERPVLGFEDESEHVMLRKTSEMEEDAFFAKVRQEIESRDLDRRNCFVFVHGYNVSFEKAAMRTAQIHHDLKFAGVPMFYSWPSRGNVRSYFSDRNEIGSGSVHIKNFLLDTAERTGAQRIHVIAHSMGADFVGKAIVAMGDRGRIFDQIVLAAPDIDAQEFRLNIAPQMQKIANRTTLYCSRNDLALHASYAFNDGQRLGDSSRGIIVLEGFDTIDASDMETDLLGHSYYGDCKTMLGDVQLLIDKNLSPIDRKLSSQISEKLNYWTFAKAKADGG